MSVKVPYESVQYQSHHHCQCDFCNSRRNVNAKKFGVSSKVAQLQGMRHKTNCCCSCHDVLAQQSFGSKTAPSFELDDPEHHVNQTELNAKNGRTGLPNGDKYTTAAGSTRGLRDTAAAEARPKSKEEQEKEAMEDLDRLERLLILEHKARVKTVADAENLALLGSTGKGPRPQPFEPARTPSAEERKDKTIPEGSLVYQAGDIHEAYDNAQRCSVTPPPHCEASHRLQHAMNDVRDVARDPVNRQNPAALQRLLHRQGVPGMTPKSGALSEADFAAGANGDASGTKRFNYFGPRPEGAGVVWRKIQPSIPEDTSTGVGGLGNVDNRHLWKSTLVKGGGSVMPATVDTTNKKGTEASVTLEKTSPGAAAALSLQQRQEEEAHAQNGTVSPIPVVRD